MVTSVVRPRRSARLHWYTPHRPEGGCLPPRFRLFGNRRPLVVIEVQPLDERPEVAQVRAGRAVVVVLADAGGQLDHDAIEADPFLFLDRAFEQGQLSV